MAKSSGTGRRMRRRAARRHPGQSIITFLESLKIQSGERVGFGVISLAIVSLMLIGGGVPGAAVVTGSGVLAFLLIALGGAPAGWRDVPLLARTGLVAIAVLPLLQLIPLPPGVWHSLPGQDLRVRSLALLNAQDSWQPLTIVPLYSTQTAIVAIAFVALVGAMVHAPSSAMYALGWLILGVIAAGILVGLGQVVSNGTALRFHTIASHGALLGFLANKNHMGLLLACSMPLAAIVIDGGRRAFVARTALSIYVAVVLAALITTNSRAGLALGIIAAAVVTLRVITFRRAWIGFALGTAALFVVVLIFTTPSFEALFSRYGAVSEDLRWQFYQTSKPLIARYFAVGAGGGAFGILYQANEQLAWLKPTYVNQMHNEYPQLLLEFGLPGVAAAIILAVGAIGAGAVRWIDGDAATRRDVEFGMLILILFALHSGVDYPLRRPAMLPVFAFALALVLRSDAVARLRRRRVA